MATLEGQRHLLDRLRVIYTQPDRTVGICENLENVLPPGSLELQPLLNLLRDLCKLWPEWSGDILYPVPSAQPYAGRLSRTAPSRAYTEALHDGRLWDEGAPYGHSRWLLLGWLINELDKRAIDDPITRRGLLTRLQEVQLEVADREIPDGLCSAVVVTQSKLSGQEARLAYLEHWLMHKMWKQWPEYSGNKGYPVPHAHCSPAFAYERASAGGTLWSYGSDYGLARRRLLSWLINELEKEMPDA